MDNLKKNSTINFQLDLNPDCSLAISLISYIFSCSVASPIGWGNRIRRLHLCRGVRPSQTGPPVGHGWRPVMLRDGILVVEQTMTCNTPPWPLLELDGRLERPPPINRLVTSSLSTYDCPVPIALIADPQPI